MTHCIESKKLGFCHAMVTWYWPCWASNLLFCPIYSIEHTYSFVGMRGKWGQRLQKLHSHAIKLWSASPTLGCNPFRQLPLWGVAKHWNFWGRGPTAGIGWGVFLLREAILHHSGLWMALFCCHSDPAHPSVTVCGKRQKHAGGLWSHMLILWWCFLCSECQLLLDQVWNHCLESNYRQK